MKKYLLIATALVLAAACQKEPSASDFDGEYLVYTAHSEDVSDFSGYETFTVADSLLAIDGDNGSMFLNDWGKTVRNQYIDRMEELAVEHKPKLIIGGASAYSREWDYERMRAIADKVGAVLWIDMAHTAGIIAAGLLKNPVKYAHIVTSTTHKTLRGPRGGIILIGKDFDDPLGRTTPKGAVKKMSQVLDSSVFPGTQGGPLEHVIASKAVAFFEAQQPEFKVYQQQVLANAKALSDEFIRRGYKIVSNGTDNHLMLVDLRGKFEALNGRVAETQLERAAITVNKNMVPFDTRSAFQTSGIRVGTPAVTSRGFVEKDMVDIVGLIDEVLTSCNEHIGALSLKKGETPTPEQTAELEEHAALLENVKRRVNQMTAGVPLNKY